MARYTGPRVKKIRRFGELPNFSKKTSKKKHPPGEHGKALSDKNKKLSEYCNRLKEKQKLQYNYGITDRQLFNYVCIARKMVGSAEQNLLKLLEMRLDTIVHRMGFASTLPFARQLVSHGFVYVNQKKVTVASYQCKPDDEISLTSKKMAEKNIQVFTNKRPSHLMFDSQNLTGKIQTFVDRAEVELLVNELLVIEYYSKNF